MSNEHNHQIPTEEELRGIFKVLGEEVPGLLEKLTKILYGVKESEDFGKAVGNFYKALKDAGMSNEQAFQLTQEYMGNLNIGRAFGGWGKHMQKMGEKEKSDPME
jgi:hypothetical protein